MSFIRAQTLPGLLFRSFLLLMLLVSGTVGAEGEDESPKLLRARGPKVEGQYIVVFQDAFAASGLVHEVAAAHQAEVARVWRRVLNGGLLRGLSEGRARALAADPRVRWVEEDAVVALDADQADPPSWGLDRIDQETLPLDAAYHYDFTGNGVTVYVIDTGIRTTHEDFGGRASWGANFADSNDSDCHGHGTHVAGIAGGTAFGVAKGVDLVAVKVLDCSGSGYYSDVISGVEWVTVNAAHPAVANMSLGGLANASLDSAVDNSVTSGVFYAVSAGNDTIDACDRSPAGAALACTVGSTTSGDDRSWFSNWGTCVDVFAPGSFITSAWNSSDTAVSTISGTSMASPHVAGVAALIREEFPGFGAAEVKAELAARSIPDVVGDPGVGSPNLLLQSVSPIPRHTLAVALAGPVLGPATVTSSPGGIDCGTDCTELYEEGTAVTLSADAGPGTTFAGWSGAGCSGTGTCTVTLDADRSIVATFDVIPNTLWVRLAGNGTGTVSSSPPGIDCGADCTEVYAEGTAVTLTATPAAGSGFGGWDRADCSGNACTVTVDTAQAVEATFELVYHDLTVALGGTGLGTVTSSPAGIDCGTDCTETYAEGTAVTLTAEALPGSLVGAWSDPACPAAASTCTVTVDADLSVVVSFDEDPDACIDRMEDAGSWKATAGPGDSGTEPWGLVSTESHSPSASFFVSDEGTVKDQVLVTPASFHVPAGSAPQLVFWHRFATELSFDGGVLEYSADGGASWFDVTSGDGVAIPENPGRFFENGYNATLSSSGPLPGRAAWSGESAGWQQVRVDLSDFAGYSLLLRWRLGADASVAGQGWWLDDVLLAGGDSCPLRPVPMTVTLAGTGVGTVTSSPPGIDCGTDCAELYGEGAVVTLTATPEPGSTFIGWDGAGCTGTGTCTVTMTAAGTVAATFESLSESLTVTLTGPGTGTVTSSPPGIDCGTDCTEVYGAGTVVTLTAVPAPGSLFRGWSGAGCAGTGTCTVTIDATTSPAGATSVEAGFDLSFHDLTVTLAGAGTGTVVSSPPGIDCGTDCTETYLEGIVVTLTAVPAPASVFGGWSGVGCSAATDCAVTIDGALSLQATFDPPPETCLDSMEDGAENWAAGPGPGDGGGTEPWHLAATSSHSPVFSLFVAGEEGVKDQVLLLLSPVSTAPAASPRLLFWHRFDTEYFYDGGVLEYSPDGGTSWLDITSGDGNGIPDGADRFLAGGYNATLSPANPLLGRPGWTGESGGWQQVVVDLADFAGFPVLLRWRMGNDDSVAGEGWWLDDVQLTDVSCPFESLSTIFADGFESGDLSAWSAAAGRLF